MKSGRNWKPETGNLKENQPRFAQEGETTDLPLASDGFTSNDS